MRIGTDASGNGNSFGPLVVTAVLATPETERRLKALGVRDSKAPSHMRSAAVAPRIREVLGPTWFGGVAIAPEEYPLLHEPLQGVGALLGWAHA